MVASVSPPVVRARVGAVVVAAPVEVGLAVIAGPTIVIGPLEFALPDASAPVPVIAVAAPAGG